MVNLDGASHANRISIGERIPDCRRIMNWISVKDAAPLEDEWILFSDGDCVQCGICMDGNFVNPDLNYFQYTGITHWMALPLPPKDNPD